MELDLTLPRDSRASALARRALSSWRPDDVPPGILDDVELLASELIANSVRHAPTHGDASEIVLHARMVGPRVRVEVIDPGPGFEHVVQEPDPLQTNGRGLYLLDVLADRWGIEKRPSTCVWFELERH